VIGRNQQYINHGPPELGLSSAIISAGGGTAERCNRFLFDHRFRVAGLKLGFDQSIYFIEQSLVAYAYHLLFIKIIQFPHIVVSMNRHIIKYPFKYFLYRNRMLALFDIIANI
jgi:hypothetical protein